MLHRYRHALNEDEGLINELFSGEVDVDGNTYELLNGIDICNTQIRSYWERVRFGKVL